MALADWSSCPGCRFPCRGREMSRAVGAEGRCALCEAAVGPHDVRRVLDPLAHLRRTVFAGMLGGVAT